MAPPRSKCTGLPSRAGGRYSTRRADSSAVKRAGGRILTPFPDTRRSTCRQGCLCRLRSTGMEPATYASRCSTWRGLFFGFRCVTHTPASPRRHQQKALWISGRDKAARMRRIGNAAANGRGRAAMELVTRAARPSGLASIMIHVTVNPCAAPGAASGHSHPSPRGNAAAEPWERPGFGRRQRADVVLHLLQSEQYLVGRGGTRLGRGVCRSQRAVGAVPVDICPAGPCSDAEAGPGEWHQGWRAELCYWQPNVCVYPRTMSDRLITARRYEGSQHVRGHGQRKRSAADPPSRRAPSR